MTIRVIVATLTMLGLGVGCTQKLAEILNIDPQAKAIEAEETDANRLLDYYSTVSNLQGDPLLREYQRAQRVFTDEPNDHNRMQLVILLSSRNAPFRDTNAAKILLQTWLDDESNADPKLQPLAELFDDYLTEVNRLDDTIAHQTGMLGKSSERIARQAQSLDAEKIWSAKLQKKYDIEKARTAALQKKLDALLEVEMNLIEREQITNPNDQ